ncbi:MAG: CotH kinase family protein, partial [Eubacteriales bacterium]|nr:CotH kinase family protein [Eubacteriales bacterium]
TLDVPEYVEKVFNKNEVIEININISEENFNNLIENAMQEEYVTADITINDTTIKNVGIRAKGNSSLQQVASNDETDRFSFKVNFSEYISDQNLYGLEKMALNNMISDSTYLKEYMSYEIMEFLYVNTPAYAFANIKINNEDWGLYLAIEVLEEDFLERYYGKDYGNLYKPESDNLNANKDKGNAPPNMERPDRIAPPENQPLMEDENSGNENQGIGNIEQPPRNEVPTGSTNLGNENQGMGNMEEPPENKPLTESTNLGNENQDIRNMPEPPENQPLMEDENSGNENQDMGNMPELPENKPPTESANLGNENQDMGDMPAPPENQNNNFARGGRQSNKETALLYIDDNISSYSTIFDGVVTKGLTDVDKNNYIKMVKALNEGTDLEKYLDVDEILRYFAVNTFLVNLDSYASNMKHNYYLYEEDGVFQILPWDFNLSFGTFQMNSGERVINFPIDTPVTDTMENSPLISKLLEVEEYKELYHSYLNEIVENYVNNGTFENTINKMNNLIYNYVANDKTAFYTIDEYKVGIESLLIYGEDRAKSISLQLDGTQPSEEYGNLETDLDISALGGTGNGKGGGGIRENNTEKFNNKNMEGGNLEQKQFEKFNENNKPVFNNRNIPPNSIDRSNLINKIIEILLY